MAIYGINFNCQPIPAEAKFAKRLGSTFRAVGANAGCTWSLRGVCQSEQELGHMLVQADNGHRLFHVVRRGTWIAVYIGYK